MNILDLEWSENMKTGVEFVDEDHKVLVDLIRDLFSAIFLGLADQDSSAIMTRLVDYTKYHFEREEIFLREHASPAMDQQTMEHRDFVDKISTIAEQHVELDMEFFKFMWDWLVLHIMETDKAALIPLSGKN
jgi:hemerythrin-like metal-binding protein